MFWILLLGLSIGLYFLLKVYVLKESISSVVVAIVLAVLIDLIGFSKTKIGVYTDIDIWK